MFTYDCSPEYAELYISQDERQQKQIQWAKREKGERQDRYNRKKMWDSLLVQQADVHKAHELVTGVKAWGGTPGRPDWRDYHKSVSRYGNYRQISRQLNRRERRKFREALRLGKHLAEPDISALEFHEAMPWID